MPREVNLLVRDTASGSLRPEFSCFAPESGRSAVVMQIDGCILHSKMLADSEMQGKSGPPRLHPFMFHYPAFVAKLRNNNRAGSGKTCWQMLLKSSRRAYSCPTFVDFSLTDVVFCGLLWIVTYWYIPIIILFL